MTAQKPRLEDTKIPYLKTIHLKVEKLGQLDTREDGTFYSTKIDFMYSKNKRIGISEILLKYSEIKFNKIVIKIHNLRYSTTREKLLTNGKAYRHQIFEDRYNYLMPISEYEVEEVEPTLFNNNNTEGGEK